MLTAGRPVSEGTRCSKRKDDYRVDFGECFGERIVEEDSYPRMESRLLENEVNKGQRRVSES